MDMHALSVVMYANGRPLLIDPGTFSYTGHRSNKLLWSTPAHNTVSVNGKDQAKQQYFMWSKPYESEVLFARQVESTVAVVINHTGYHDEALSIIVCLSLTKKMAFMLKIG